MLTRRNFLRFVATFVTGMIGSACVRVSPTPTPSAPTPVLQIAAPQATETATPTLAPTVTFTPTATPLPPAPAPTSTPPLPELVTIRGDQFYYRGKLFPINGFNYYPRLHPWKTFNAGEWEPSVTEKELKLSKSLGANVVRIFVDYNFSVDSKSAQPTPTLRLPVEGYVKNVREFLDIAGRLDLQVIVTLFDSMDWALYKPENRWIAEEYLKAFVPPFVNDPRIMCWDLQNEPDRAIVGVGSDAVMQFFKRLALLTRSLDRNHLRTIGWIDRARARYFAELDDYLDFWCFHFYDHAARFYDLARFYKNQTKKPVLLEEFGLPTGGPGYESASAEYNQVLHYRRILVTLQDLNLCGSVLWCLNDFPVGLAGNPPIKTDSPENHFGVLRLDYSEKLVCNELRDFWLPRLKT